MRNVLLLTCTLFAGSTFAAVTEERPLSFNKDIRPIFSDKCFACHGFDAKHREADRRLDTAEGAYATIDGVQAIVPGDLAKSDAWQRIISSDKDEVMPPPKSHKTLTDAEKTTIKKWIEQGAKYQRHWAFEAPVKPAVPEVLSDGVLSAKSPSGPVAGLSTPAVSTQHSPIDAFLRARLASEKLAPAPEADRETLIRRVAFTLTGLPPTVREVEDFLGDPSATAYERMVDRYLASPRYGEEMAKHWLDVARYADTHGLHLDNERSMWPYRDWVVRAFNDNLPFDQFTVWQLAGDLIPKATRDQQIASGFNRCNVTTSEGGSINEEYIFRYAVDRASTTVEVWMGLTAGCAVCHDHKFDPITQKEFYSLYSFFNSSADPAMDGNILLTPPTLRLANDAQSAQLAKFEKEIAAAQKRVRDSIASIGYQDPSTVQPPPEVITSETVWFEDDFPAGTKPNADRGQRGTFVTKDDGVVQSGERALRQSSDVVASDYFSGGASFELPPNGKIAVWVNVAADAKPRALMLQLHTSGWNHRAVWGEEGVIPYGKVRTPEHLRVGNVPEPGVWTKLEFPIEKLGLKPGTKITGYAFTEHGGTVTWDRLAVSSRVDPAKDPQWSFAVWKKNNQGKRVEALPNDLLTLVRGKKPEEWSEAEAKRVQDWWFENEYQDAPAEMRKARAERLALEEKKKTLESEIPATFVMADLPQPRPAFIMKRGQYNVPGDPVEPGTPAFLPALAKPQPEARATRLDLAQWLVAPEHPLTARVAVNRLWQQVFGVGLVKTSADFGSQGEPPTHPELLDWLAVTFRESGWDVKRLVRSLLLTQAFRQQSRVTPELFAKDPENRLLARGPRFRLDAEQIRDNALFVSGLLDLTMGGKGVRTYQPPNIWEPVGFVGSNTRFYKQDTGSALYRRSLYTFLKRTAPAPFMVNFDAPNREQSCSRRERSNTPLQALQLMNDVQHFEAARAFAEQMLAQGGDTPESRITFAYRTALSRKPEADELKIVRAQLDTHLAEFGKDEEAAKKAIAHGESKPRVPAPPVQLAAYTMVANMILNLDETVNRN